MLHNICLLVVITIVYSSLGNSQEKTFGTRGVTEIAGGVSFSSITSVASGKTGDATTILSLAPQLGYFVVDGFELGITTGMTLLPGVSVLTPERGDGTTIVQLFFSPSYNYHAEGSKVCPFIEPQIGYTSMSSGSSSQSGFSYGVRAGIKVIAVEHFLVSLSGQYVALTFNESGATERSGFNYLAFGVGVAGYF